MSKNNLYAETLAYLYAQLPMFQRLGAAAIRKMDLQNIEALCQVLGQPQENLVCLHVAGTNGKGSVAHLLAAFFQAAGYCVGLYTSPHYRDFRERIRVNGALIEEAAVVDFVQRHRTTMEGLGLSFFEMTFGLALDYFRASKVEIAIIEVGLGGRLDSTNIIQPLMSIVTSIGFDHQDILGHTLPRIAREKAGIFKPKVPALIGENLAQTRPVFYEQALRRESPLYFAEEICQVELVERDLQGARYRVMTGQGEVYWSELFLDLAGIYQVANLRTALAAWQLGQNLGLWQISPEQIAQACASVRALTGFQGRWQVLSHQPLTLCDAAHNAHGLAPILKDLETWCKGQLHLVFGMVKDKDLSSVLKLLPPQAQYYFCKADVPRGLEADVLAQEAARYGLRAGVYPSVKSALAAAQSQAQGSDWVFVGGSIFVVAEVL